MEFIIIGKILNTHGVKGELKVEVFTDFKEERFKENTKVYIGENHLEVVVKSYRMHHEFMLLTLKDLEDINLVLPYKNMYIYKSSEDIKPLKDNYYFRDLYDLDVFVNNSQIGKILNLESGSRHNNIRIKTNDNKEVLVPYLPQFVKHVDLDNKRIDLENLEGLLWK